MIIGLEPAIVGLLYDITIGKKTSYCLADCLVCFMLIYQGPHKIQGIGAGFAPGVLNVSIVNEVVQVRVRNDNHASRLIPLWDMAHSYCRFEFAGIK